MAKPPPLPFQLQTFYPVQTLPVTPSMSLVPVYQQTSHRTRDLVESSGKTHRHQKNIRHRDCHATTAAVTRKKRLPTTSRRLSCCGWEIGTSAYRRKVTTNPAAFLSLSRQELDPAAAKPKGLDQRSRADDAYNFDGVKEGRVEVKTPETKRNSPKNTPEASFDSV